MSKIEPIKIDIFSIRENRQINNNLLALECIKNKIFTKNINIKEYNKFLLELKSINITEENLLEQCETNNIIKLLLADKISINASRQGTKDESLQLDICKSTFLKCDIILKNLSATSFRPTKNGEILDKNELKKRGIKNEDCLKSFDARFSGKINGWIFAKIVIGTGGHQDNVFEEALTLCEWVSKYGNTLDLYIILIDTDLAVKYNNLIEKYKIISNLLIGNHLKIQQYIIDNYYESENGDSNK